MWHRSKSDDVHEVQSQMVLICIIIGLSRLKGWIPGYSQSQGMVTWFSMLNSPSIPPSNFWKSLRKPLKNTVFRETMPKQLWNIVGISWCVIMHWSLIPGQLHTNILLAWWSTNRPTWNYLFSSVNKNMSRIKLQKIWLPGLSCPSSSICPIQL